LEKTIEVNYSKQQKLSRSFATYMMTLPNLSWRSELLTKNWLSTPVQVNQISQTFLCVVVPYNRDKGFNSGKEVYGMEELCRISVQSQSARQYFTHWLQDHGHRQVHLDMTMVKLYQIYLVTQLQLRFWRKVLEMGEYVPTVDENYSGGKVWRHKTAILGSLPCSKYLEKHGGCSWKAKDCDVFTDSMEAVIDIINLYNVMILTPLDLALHVQTDEGSFRSNEHQNMDLQLLLDMFEIESNLKKESENMQGSNDCVHCEDDSMTSTITSLDDLSETEESPNDAFWTKDVIAWTIDNHDIKEFLSCVRKPSLNVPTYEQADWKAMCRELKRTVYNVPERFQENSYDILGTLMIGTNFTGVYSKVLVPINVILIQSRGSMSNASIHQTVSNGFDLLHCAVGFDVNADLQFSFKEYNPWAFTLLKSRRLCLGPGSFHGCVANTIPQLRRIWKYITRGFQW